MGKREKNNYKFNRKLTALIITIFIINFSAAAQQQLTAAVPEEFQNSLDKKILISIAEKLDTELTIKAAPFARRLHYMETGCTDITAGLLKNKEREKYTYYINPPYKLKSNKVFFVRKGKASSISKYEDLHKLTIGTNIKSRYFSRFDNDPEITKEPTRSFSQNIQKLLAGRIDAVIYTDGYGFLRLKDTDMADKVETAIYHYSKDNPVYIGISRQSYLMSRIEEVETIIQSMSKTGEFDKIISDYYTSRNLPVPQYK